ncbi:phenylalanyl-tRNA synthetase alpha subunit, mitochondrial [Microbotryomycetes sp. JL221]|nr:phenylalanyl-tRNA synthetase alpha subunit, mitochondrial [Microbotryomycetes sp. JL221]
MLLVERAFAARRVVSCTCTHLARRTRHTWSTEPITLNGQSYERDEWTNVTPTILSKVGRNLHLQPNHPLSTLRLRIEQHFKSFQHLNTLSPVVTVEQNFDDLGFPVDHPGRSLTDSYYINKHTMLRTHTSAHEVQHFRQGLDSFLLTSDVYRRDEIDKSHYPVFHQVEGCNVTTRQGLDQFVKENERMQHQLDNSNIVITDPTIETTLTNPIQPQHTTEEAQIISQHLKNSLNSMVLHLFGDSVSNEGQPLQVRWIEATFPWTAPSYEVEVLFNGQWLEILGCGVVKQAALERSNQPNKLGWAFGLGLERIAMVMFGIPDIRLFWSQDSRFISQFKQDKVTQFKPYSKYPECYKDFSFWTSSSSSSQGQQTRFHENEFCEVVRDVAGDLIEDVQKIDEFVHPTTARTSVCYRLNYRSMDRSLSNEEINELHTQVVNQVVERIGVEAR